MKIFVLGVPHTQTTTQFTTCAFTMKVWNLCAMLKRRGHEVIHLGTEGSNPECTENIAVTPYDMWKKLYGHPGTKYYDLNTEGENRPYHDLYIKNTRAEIEKRLGEPHTAIIAIPWGGSQRIATQGLPQYIVESGIGYRHTFANYRIFESYAWMHFLFGVAQKFDGARWYDVVIPNAFNPKMFQYAGYEGRQEHLLYIGRLNDDKGVGFAAHIAKVAGRKLFIAGQGDPERFLKGNPHVTYLGPLGLEDRKKAMSECRAVICPTFYIEPFCGVAVEAQMSGTPVITTDWGAFSEHVQHGHTGFRCRTFEQFVWAVKNIDKIDNKTCRDWACTNYSLDRIVLMYEEYFQQVLNIKNGGMYCSHDKREQLDWLKKSYPGYMDKDIDLDIKHIPPEPKSQWQQALDWETNWWGKEPQVHWTEEVKKQLTYARLIGLPHDLNMENKRILDIGCGPVSMLLRAKHGLSYGLDPLPISDEVKKVYSANNIMFINSKAEDIEHFDEIDEVWMYNCLQHTEDPRKILRSIANMKVAVRIFEWINLPPCPGHPQTLTRNMFEEAFPKDSWDRLIWNTGCLHGFGGTATNEYLAIHIEPKGIRHD